MLKTFYINQITREKVWRISDENMVDFSN
uniref:Uncharacterized protein n=1 Tax=Arundo donax TaxID=35708 RepID=A0A0A9EUH2_ARUDO